ncbi:MAG: hypothetical protein JXP34_19355 [Planctomycetes bacterium]|nr:hypothetical protein [Planctomycetota bacterium]
MPLLGAEGSPAPIDRRALVTRHNVQLRRSDFAQVGNGEFAFTADITGLQTFEPYNTMSHWGWHSSPLPPGTRIEDFRPTEKRTCDGRIVPFPIGTGDAISRWLEGNPHRFNLGRLGLRMTMADGSAVGPEDLGDARQTLDLWTGLLSSRFEIDGRPVEVETCCHPSMDTVAVRIRAPLIAAGRLKVELAFPYPDLGSSGGYGDWARPDAHETRIRARGDRRIDIERRIDADAYHVGLAWAPAGRIEVPDAGAAGGAANRHRIVLAPETGAAGAFEITCAFSPAPLPEVLPSVGECQAACRAHWPSFWDSGGAIDLSGSRDPRWKELERRIVLSQYLMAVNEAGSLPPQESGLVNNGWYGRFHFEMYWWHAAHYALWDRWPSLERSLDIYRRLLPVARERARRQGYAGARWPKCTGPDGREWPHPIHAMLIWQQPHPIFFAELSYRAHPTEETLEAWREVIFETAAFMASLPCRDEATGRRILGPPLYVVSENTDPDATRNPTFELSYWRFGLRLAQTWRERLGMPRDSAWDEVLERLAPLPVDDGLYVLHEGVEDMWAKWTWEHPALVGAYGWLPGDGVEVETMRRTFRKVMETWNFGRTWGWDFPMMAMCAARLGEGSRAIDLLLHEKFRFSATGLSSSGPFPYFPSNGGLLYALAMMVAGWDGAPQRSAPGFPDDGSWVVRWEGLRRAP